ncbi:MAG: NERD domain-containing protein [Promethearchaeota archaeon]
MDRNATQVVLSSLLKCKNASISIELLAGLTGIANLELLNNIINQIVTAANITRENHHQFNLTPQSRLKLAFLLIKTGVDIENVAKYLDWKEFEAFTKDILLFHEFQVHSRVRFKSSKKKRYELDLLAIRNSIILCIDCKHWSSRAGKKYALKNAVEKQVERTIAFSKEMDFSKLEIEKSDDLHLIPLLISWLVEDIKTYQNVPIIPIFQLSNFLNQIEVYKDEFKTISFNK